jgi:hypothetical protein
MNHHHIKYTTIIIPIKFKQDNIIQNTKNPPNLAEFSYLYNPIM